MRLIQHSGKFIGIYDTMNMLKSAGKLMSTAFTDKYIEKPDHQSIRKTDDYEVRQYPETLWVSTKVESLEQKAALSTGFRRLFNYITGANVAGEKIDMTAPVISKVDPGAGPNCENTFTVSFYVGKDHQPDPPTPTDSTVFINKYPAMQVYAREYDGFSNDEACVTQASALAAALSRDDIHDYEHQTYHFAGYDSPFKLFNRRNEIWFIRQAEEYNELS